MFQNLGIFQTAMSMARHAGLQQAVSAQNIANADTPGYHALEVPDFAQSLNQPLMGMRATRTDHLNGEMTDGSVIRERRGAVDPNGNTVSLETEMVTAVGAKRAHDRALAIYRSNLTLLRASLGR